MTQVKKQKSPALLWSVEKVIKTYGLFDPGARILIGVSGGPDSMALLSLLSELRPKWALELMVLYCHHGLRLAADEEESFVRDWSRNLDCLFFSRRLPVREYQKETGKSLQEAARELRYRAFAELIKQKAINRVALAHTANDQAEEVLIGLIRGTGLGGLIGMP
ncbi:MAG: tRNA lysidine(34) synthetase TilS, partial [Desulfobacca sp.]|nr:tRNA lysidine(34) synthetase TilS [Desulfobacca sp.]